MAAKAKGEGLRAETIPQKARSIWRLGVGVGIKPAGIGGCLEAVSAEGSLECVVSFYENQTSQIGLCLPLTYLTPNSLYNNNEQKDGSELVSILGSRSIGILKIRKSQS